MKPRRVLVIWYAPCVFKYLRDFGSLAYVKFNLADFSTRWASRVCTQCIESVLALIVRVYGDDRIIGRRFLPKLKLNIGGVLLYRIGGYVYRYNKERRFF